MQKLIVVLLISICFQFPSYSQTFNWAKKIGGSGIIGGFSDIDSSGFIYSAGTFSNTVDFDPGSGTFNITSAGPLNAYIIKLGANGNLVWAKTFAGLDTVGITAIKVEKDGTIFLAGAFKGQVDFDPGNNIFNMNSDSGSMFVMKLNNTGDFSWAKELKSTQIEGPIKIQTDHLGNVFTIGYINRTIDFDPGPAQFNLSRDNPASDYIFISKLDASGNFSYAKSIESGNMFVVYDLAPDLSGNLLVSGYFRHNTDFDPGPNTAYFTPPTGGNDFLLKLNPQGNFIWNKVFGSADGLRNLEVDSQGNIIMCGGFSFDFAYVIGSQTYVEMPKGVLDMFFLKLTGNGDVLWVKSLGGPGFELVYETALDNNDNILFTSPFSGTIDFDPGPGQFFLTGDSSSTIRDFAVGKFASNGDFLWAGKLKTTSDQYPRKIMANKDGDVIQSGHFTGTIDFDPGPNEYLLTSSGDYNFYVFKWSEANYINGKVFFDDNGNGTMQSSDFGMSQVIIKAEKGNEIKYTTSDSLGNFFFATDTGAYNLTIPVIPTYFSSVNPTVLSVNFDSSTAQTSDTAYIGIKPIPNMNDLSIHVTNVTPARPGFQTKYRVTYKNMGTTHLSGTLHLIHANSLQFLNSIPVHSSYSAGQINWSYSNLKPFETKSIDILFNIPATVQIGTNLKSITSINSANSDVSPANNSDTLNQLVTGSFDPNDKKVTPDGNISPEFVTGGKQLDYTIRFQNTGTDTAFTVVVRDTLSNKVDLKSFQMISASHAYTLKFTAANELEWHFDNIMLPDSNVNQLLSHGFIRYSVKPIQNLSVGEQIRNKAGIYFDFNEPIFTNQTINTVTVITSLPGITQNLSRIFPNPARTYLQMQVLLPFQYNIYDLSGREIYSGSSASGVGTLKIDQLSKGLYLLQIRTKNRMEYHKFVVE